MISIRRLPLVLALLAAPAVAQDSYLSALPARTVDGTEQIYCEDPATDPPTAYACTTGDISGGGTTYIFLDGTFTNLLFFDLDGDDAATVTDGSEARGFYTPPRYAIDEREEFLGELLSTTNETLGFPFRMTGSSTNAGCGGAIPQADLGAHPGILDCDTGTTSSGLGAVNTTGLAMIFGTGDYYGECLIKTPSVLSTNTQRYEINCGFQDHGTSFLTITDAAYFVYEEDINGGKWAFYTYSNTTTGGPVDTTVTVAVDTWYRLSVHVNAAASLATACVNGANCVTSNVNIPSGTTRATGFGYNLKKKVGSTQVDAYLDYLWFHWDATTAR